MFLLDTNVISELRRPSRTNPLVAAWIDGVPQADLFLSSISLMELRTGARRLIHRGDTHGNVIQDWIETRVLAAFAGRILAVDEAVALRCADLHVPVSRPYRDSLIAATALVHRITLVTRNLSDFQPMTSNLLNPWI